MARLGSGDPDVLEFQRGTGILNHFGVPLILAGLGLIGSLIGPCGGGGLGSWLVVLFALAVGLALIAAGAALAFGRAGTSLDRRRGVVASWWGAIVPLGRTERPLADFAEVRAAAEIRRSSSAGSSTSSSGPTYTVYPVSLVGPGGCAVRLETTRDLLRARSLGERVAKFTGLKLVDTTMGTEIVREAAELDESLRERARRTGQRGEVPEPPPGARAVHTVSGDHLVIGLPPRGLHWPHHAAMGFGVVVSLVMLRLCWSTVLGWPSMQGLAKLVVGALLALFILGPILFAFLPAVRSARARASVEVCPGYLRVARPGLFGARVISIPTARLEELAIVNEEALRGRRGLGSWLVSCDVIAARSDEAAVAFGAGLSRAELEWIKAVIHMIAAA